MCFPRGVRRGYVLRPHSDYESPTLYHCRISVLSVNPVARLAASRGGIVRRQSFRSCRLEPCLHVHVTRNATIPVRRPTGAVTSIFTPSPSSPQSPSRSRPPPQSP